MEKHREFLKDLQTSEQFYNDQESREIIGELIAMIDEGLNEQPKADWISCEERLPSEVGEYLVAYSNGDMTIQHFYGKVFSEIDSFNSIIACQPIAWQPLTQPYKKEGAEKEE